MALLEIQHLKKRFAGPEGTPPWVIDIPQFEIQPQAQVALSGESGSGKSTLLHLIAGILRPDSGRIFLAGQEISALPEPARDRIRASSVGYIFQTFHLLPAFSCLENVLLGMAFGPGPDPARARQLLERVGLDSRLHHRPHQLSTGQQQRVAVARALANRPRLVLADEPTGNLDRSNARQALELIRQACRENGAALLLVSHDPELLKEFDHVFTLAGLNRAAQPRP